MRQRRRRSRLEQNLPRQDPNGRSNYAGLASFPGCVWLRGLRFAGWLVGLCRPRAGQCRPGRGTLVAPNVGQGNRWEGLSPGAISGRLPPAPFAQGPPRRGGGSSPRELGQDQRAVVEQQRQREPGGTPTAPKWHADDAQSGTSMAPKWHP